jgi:hypothetical protein
MNSEPTDVEKFTKDVAKEIEAYDSMKPFEVSLPEDLLTAEQKRKDDEMWHFFLNPPPGVNFQQPQQQFQTRRVLKISGPRKKKGEAAIKNPPAAEQLVAIGQALQAARQSPFRRAICAVLTSSTKDAFDIAKLLTPILLPLSLAGTIAIPAAPVAYAALSIIVARMGVAAFCSIPKDDKD